MLLDEFSPHNSRTSEDGAAHAPAISYVGIDESEAILISNSQGLSCHFMVKSMDVNLISMEGKIMEKFLNGKICSLPLC